MAPKMYRFTADTYDAGFNVHSPQALDMLRDGGLPRDPDLIETAVVNGLGQDDDTYGAMVTVTITDPVVQWLVDRYMGLRSRHGPEARFTRSAIAARLAEIR